MVNDELNKFSKSVLLSYESDIANQGYANIAGIDEAGRGPLAGPVVAGSVVFQNGVFIEGVRDSKKLSHKRREELYDIIIEKCTAYGVGIIDNNKIDEINIYQASKLAMMTAIENMSIKPDFLLVDAMKLDTDIPNLPLIKGDLKSFTIAAASIIAKVTRDRIMFKLHEEYPQYGWKQNKGYPTKAHREAVKKYGFSPYHRRTFRVR